MREFISSKRWSNHRIAAAFLLAPVIPSFVTTTVAGSGFPPPGILLVALMWCWIVSMLFGFPVFVILRRREKVSLWTSIASGALIAAGLFAFVMGLGRLASFEAEQRLREVGGSKAKVPSYELTTRDYINFGELGVSAVLLGSSIGFFFWLIGIWRNPAFMPLRDQHPEDLFT